MSQMEGLHEAADACKDKTKQAGHLVKFGLHFPNSWDIILLSNQRGVMMVY